MKTNGGSRTAKSETPDSVSGGGVPKASAKAADSAPPDADRFIAVPSSRPGEIKPNAKTVSVEEFWKGYYQDRDEDAQVLRQKIGILNASKKFRDVKAILVAYLTYRSDHSEPWMYAALALAIKENGGDEKEIKKSLGYAADMALKTHNPNPIVSVADQLFLFGYFDRVGELLDVATEMIPHRSEPMMMSINLAQKLKDPKRMGDSVESLLSLGWPNDDDVIRRNARKQLDRLVKTLREEDRNDEADALLARLPEIEARDVFIRLTWTGDADLDLVVDEPLGATARYQSPRTVFGGSIVKNGYGNHPEEVYVCPRGFDGDYVVKVDTVYNNPKKIVTTARLEIIEHEGTPEESKKVVTVKIAKTTAEPVKFDLKGGRRTKVLPFVAPDNLNKAIMEAASKAARARLSKDDNQSAQPKAKPKP